MSPVTTVLSLKSAAFFFVLKNVALLFPEPRILEAFPADFHLSYSSSFCNTPFMRASEKKQKKN